MLHIKHIRIYLTLLVLFLASCKQDKERIDEQLIFRYNEAAGITSLDPAFSRTFENLWAVNQLFEGLVQLDDNMNIIPAIARSWEILDDGRRYEFYLRDDIYFHSNSDFEKRKVTATDFKYSFERIISDETASPGKWVFSKVLENGIKVIDDYTLVIELSESFPPFLSILSMKYCSVVLPEAVELYGEDFRSKPVGTGPFKFHFWEENQLLTMLKNPDYYMQDDNGESLPYLHAVSVSFKKDMNSVFLDFLKGSYDMLQGIEGTYKEELLNENGRLREAYKSSLVLEKTPWLKTDYLGFLIDSTKNPANPFMDIRVRRAVNHSIDRRMLTKVLLRNLGNPALGGFLPEGFASHSAYFESYNYDPSKAILLLKEAGYSLQNPLELELNTTAAYADLAEFIQHQLSVVGIKLNVSILEAGNLNEMVANSDLNFFKKSWLADYPDEENFMALFYSGNFCPDGPNYTHYKRDDFDALYEQSIFTIDPGKRRSLYVKMDSLVAEEHAIVPLFYGSAVKFLQNSIEGLPSSAVNMLDLRRVRKEKAN